MRRFPLLPVLLLGLASVAGCAHRHVPDSEHAVRVEAVRAHFTPGDRGDVELDLSVVSPGLQAGALIAIDWQLWLGNRWFAAGTQRLAEPLPDQGRHRFTVSLPIVFRRTNAPSEEPSSVEVGVRGGVMVRSGGVEQRLPFRHREWLEVENAPNPAGGEL